MADAGGGDDLPPPSGPPLAMPPPTGPPAGPPTGPPRGPLGPLVVDTGPPEPERGGRSPAVWVLGGVGVVAVLVLVAAVAVFVVGGSADAEVILEPTSSNGDDPFMDSVAKVDPDVEGGGFGELAGGADEVESVEGAAPGLYGGTGDEAACDAAAMVEFLEENDEEAAAWAEVAGIAPADIRGYVAGLTPLVLREDTRVTNHGFSGGEANAFQAVLQAGTAVMVDGQGVPRVRCACGNPLAEPEAVSDAGFSGDEWGSFDATRLVAVSPGPEVEAFEVVDLETGEPEQVPIGSLAEPTTAEQLVDAEVPETTRCRAGRLEDGVLPGIPPGEGLQEISEGSIAIGDFTGDGVDDGAFIQVCGFGGNAVFEDVVAYSNGATLLGALPVDDYGDTVFAIRIVDGALEVDFGEFLPGDNNADGPSGRSTARFVWDGSAFVEPGQESSGGDTSDLAAFLDELFGPTHAGSCEGLDFDQGAPDAVCSIVIEQTDDRAVVDLCYPQSECAGAFLLERDADGAWQVAEEYPYSAELPAPPDYPPEPDWLVEARQGG